MIEFKDGDITVRLFFNLDTILNKYKNKHFIYFLQDKIEEEIKNLAYVTKVNMVMSEWLECRYEKKEEIKEQINQNIEKWIKQAKKDFK